MIVILVFLGFLILGGVAPYVRQPEVGEDYQNQFDAESFYADATSCDRAAIVEGNGDALIERVRMIEHAKERVILSTFDFRSDTAGKQMLSALISAAERGVRVQILTDGFNFLTHMKGNSYFYALVRTENIEFKVYNPVNLLTPWKGMSRMHDKYLVADEEVYLLGGRNTFNYFLGDQDSHKNYDRDVLVYNTGGEESSLYQVMDYFEGVWNLKYCKAWKPGTWLTDAESVDRASAELQEIYNVMKEELGDWFEKADYESVTVPTNKVTLLSGQTSLYSKEPQVFYGLGQLMKNAREKVVVHTPYIICNQMMYETFAEVCEAGTEVTIMTNSARNNGNPFGAADYVLHKEKILDTGVNVLEYDGGISYHAKSMVIDDDLAIVGSFNMDMKSVYQDTELMLVVNSKELSAQLSELFEVYQEDAVRADPERAPMEELFGGDVSGAQKIERFFIMLLDPLLRFLL